MRFPTFIFVRQRKAFLIIQKPRYEAVITANTEQGTPE